LHYALSPFILYDYLYYITLSAGCQVNKT